MDALRAIRFEDDESVIRAVRTWLREQETSWYREGMHTPVSRWRKAVDVTEIMWKNYMSKGNIQFNCAGIAYILNERFFREEKKKWDITF